MKSKDILIELLKAKDCWANGEPEIPEEISAQFDIGLDLARDIVECVNHTPISDLVRDMMREHRSNTNGTDCTIQMKPPECNTVFVPIPPTENFILK